MPKGKKPSDIPLSVVLAIAAVLVVLFLFKFPTAPSDLVSAPIVSGDNQLPAESSYTAEPTRVSALSTILARARNSDLDPEKDVIEVIVSPKDADGNVVRTDGVVSATLWSVDYDEEYNKIKGALIEDWPYVRIAAGGYSDYGHKVVLELKNYVPQQNDYGILEVTLTAPDGQSFTAAETELALGIIY